MNSPLHDLFADARKHASPKGQILVRAGEEPRGAYYLHSGYIKAYGITKEGESQLIAIFGPNELLPFYWAWENAYSHLFYQAMTSVEYSVINAERFLAMLENDNVLKETLAGLLLKMYKFSQRRIQNLEYKTALERIAFRLLLLGEYFGHTKGHTIYIDVPITHQEIAESLNMSRDTANRTIRALIKREVVKRINRNLAIEAPGELRNIIGVDALWNI